MKLKVAAATVEEGKTDVVGVVVGVIFATAGAVLLVLAGWFAMKKFYWGGGLVQAFD